MRVLHIIDSLASSGAETSLAEMAPALVELGTDLHVAYLTDTTDLASRLTSAGATLWPLTEDRGRLGRTRSIRKLTKRLEPDVVHTTLYEADIAGRSGAWLAGAPIVSSLVNEMYGQRQIDAGLNPAKLKMAQVLDMATVRFVSKFHAISADVAAVMGDRLHIPPERIEVIPRGRDIVRLGNWSPERRRSARSTLGIGDEVPMVLAVAREEPQKGLDTLMHATKVLSRGLPGVQVFVAGRRGSASPGLDQLESELGIESVITRLGRREDIAELMVAADVLAFPSRWEGMGGVLIEALTLECPIVCSDLPVLRETVVDEQLAAFVPANDAEALASALGIALRGRDMELLKAGRRLAEERYSIGRAARSMTELYAAVGASCLGISPLTGRWL